ncbi:MAG: helix-turn-helix domain-containing protein, partial [Lentisphaeria bacterium]|nr:helix-turn-helix domain-containing protein [Lentisphaeria bacterium]
AAEEASLLDRLDAAVARLPRLYRESLSVGVLSGYAPDEAAAMLGCTRNTLYQRIHKAKQLLAQSIREVSYEEA